MKKFNLELAKANHPVQTKDGRHSRIVCYDVKGEEHSRLLVLVSNEKVDYEFHIYCDSKGICSESNPDLDLVMVELKKECWVNVYKNNVGTICSQIFGSESDAEAAKSTYSEFLTTKKIEWEE